MVAFNVSLFHNISVDGMEIRDTHNKSSRLHKKLLLVCKNKVNASEIDIMQVEYK